MKFQRTTQVLFLLITIMLLLTVVKIYLLADLAINAYLYSYYTEESKRIERENMVVREALLEITSLQSIEAQARKQGFVEIDAYMYY